MSEASRVISKSRTIIYNIIINYLQVPFKTSLGSSDKKTYTFISKGKIVSVSIIDVPKSSDR